MKDLKEIYSPVYGCAIIDDERYMTIKEAYEILIQYNLWRRDNHIHNKYEMPNPTQLGIALDTVIAVLRDLLHNESIK